MMQTNTHSRTEQWMARLRKFTPLIGLILFGVAAFVVDRQLEQYSWSEIRHALLMLAPSKLAVAFAFMLLSYASLGAYDVLGLEYAGQRLPYRKIALASFLSYALSNNVGYAVLSGGSIRLRLYSGWGVPATAIAQVLLFLTATYFLSVLLLLVSSFLAIPPEVRVTAKLPAKTIYLIMGSAASLLALWWATLVWRRDALHIKHFTLPMPKPGLALRQLVVGALSLALSAMVLYALLVHRTDMSIAVFFTLFLLAQLIGVVSQVPGGIGVFEGSFLFLFEGRLPTSQIFAALIAYRLIYFVAPLIIAAVIFLIYEMRKRSVWTH